jgi:hypothetical protein
MYCTQCGREISEKSRFCIHCGAPNAGFQSAAAPDAAPQSAAAESGAVPGDADAIHANEPGSEAAENAAAPDKVSPMGETIAQGEQNPPILMPLAGEASPVSTPLPSNTSFAQALSTEGGFSAENVRPGEKRSVAFPVILLVLSVLNYGFDIYWMLFWLSSMAFSFTALILTVKGNRLLEEGRREDFLRLSHKIKLFLTAAAVVLLISLAYFLINIDYKALGRVLGLNG